MANSIKAKVRNGRLIVSVRIPFSQTIGKNELERFSRMNFYCFSKPLTVRKHSADYVGPIGVSLTQRLMHSISDYDFFFIIEQIVDMTRKLQRSSVPWDRVIWSKDAIFMNEAAKELRFLYLPVEGMQTKSNILKFMEDIIYSAIPADPKSNKLSEFSYFLRSLKSYDFERIEAYIANVEKKAVSTIRRSGSGQSGFITDKQQEYYEHYKDRPSDQDPETGLLGDESETGLLGDEPETGLLGDEPETGLLNERESTRQNGPFFGKQNAADDDGATGLLVEQPYRKDDAKQEDPSLETGLLNDDHAGSWENPPGDGTDVLNGGKGFYPTLLRVVTGETISVNKPAFRIGKERSYVDYFVSNNNAVSRSHADILTRGSRFFIKDLNSTNRTFINGKPIPAQCEIEIMNDDQIRLGNEEFIFHS